MSSRQKPAASKASAALERLRKNREQGKTGLQDYKVKTDDKVFDEVDEAGFQLIAKRRLNDDFVVDDDGIGYADYGHDDWDNANENADSDDSEGSSSAANKGKNDANKRKRPTPAAKGQLNIGDMLMKQQQMAKRKAVQIVGPSSAGPVAKPVLASTEDDLNAMFQAIDKESQQQIQSQHLRKKKKSLNELAMFGSRQEVGSSKNSLNPKATDPTSSAFQPSLQQQEPIMDAFDTETFDNDYPDEVISLPNVVAQVDEIVVDPAVVPDEVVVSAPAIKVKTASAKSVGRIITPSEIKPIVKPVVKAESSWIGKGPIVPANDSSLSDTWRFGMINNSCSEPAGQPSILNACGSTASSLGQKGDASAIFLEDTGSLLMYWIDAFEGKDGAVYLFGKVFNRVTKAFVSCCLTVGNMERSLFFLPRVNLLDDLNKETDIEVDMQSIWQEVDGIMTKNKISNWSLQPCQKKYAFEVSGIPFEADWVEVNYGFKYPALPRTLVGKSFSHTFGTNTGALELLILRSDLMGPCWLEIKDAQLSNVNISWCKVEFATPFMTLNSDRVRAGDGLNVRVLKDSDLDSGNYPDFCKTSPHLTVMSICMKTVMNYKKNVNEIAMLSALIYHSVQIDGGTSEEDQKKISCFSIVRQLNDNVFPMGFTDKVQQKNMQVETTKNETGLLNCLVAKLHYHDPDVLVGHNIIGFDLDVLLHRAKELNVNGWSKIGRLKRTQFPKMQTGVGGLGDSTYAERMVASGRLLCDTYLGAKDTIKSKSYSLSDLSASYLNVKRPEFDYENVPRYFMDSQDLLWLIRFNENDAYLAMKLCFQMMFIPLTKQLTNLAGNLWGRTMTGARAERNEFLLLHEFYKNGYIAPDKSFPSSSFSQPSITQKTKKGTKAPAEITSTLQTGEDDDEEDSGDVKKTVGKRKPAYSGGLVLEPKKGLYDKFVLMLDFNSLYPSIIQEYNICFTTVERNEAGGEDELPEIPDADLEQGILPRLLATLVQRRRQVKGIMKKLDVNGAEYAQMNLRQQALKLTANSMYGCLGFTHSRFYAKQLAMLITAKGREILQDTVTLAEQTLNLNVIYGDTDSIMIYTALENLADVKAIGQKLKVAVNKKYKCLEIEMDGYFRRMLLLKKKKYAALTVSEGDNGILKIVRETKGLDLVRRDWCGLSHDVCDYVLNQILSDAETEEVLNNIHNFLEKVGNDIRADRIPLDKFVINKALTKAPEEYNDAKSQPHVQVALKLKAKGQSTRPGETIPYVICVDEDMQKSFAMRAYHPEDIRKSEGKLKVDHEYYLNIQVHPPVARLCSPIDGTDSGRIATCLGLDPSKFRSVVSALVEDTGVAAFESRISDAERFKNVSKFSFPCSFCKETNLFTAPIRKEGEDFVSEFSCQSCKQLIALPVIASHLLIAIRRHVKLYYQNWLVCEEPSCGNRTCQTSVLSYICQKSNCRGLLHPEYSDTALYTQLLYYSTLFDVNRYLKKEANSPDKAQLETICQIHRHSLDSLLATSKQYIDLNARGYVDFSKIFAFSKKKQQVGKNV